MRSRITAALSLALAPWGLGCTSDQGASTGGIDGAADVPDAADASSAERTSEPDVAPDAENPVDAPGDRKPVAAPDGALPDAGASGACQPVEAVTAPGFSVSIPLLTRCALPTGERLTVEIRSGAMGGVVTLAGGGATAVYTPRRGFAGTDTFVFRVTSLSGELGAAGVRVHVLPETWMEVDGTLFRAEPLAAAEVGALRPHELATVATDVDQAGRVYGHRTQPSGTTGLLWEGDLGVPRSIQYPGAASTWLWHADGRRVAGTYRTAGGALAGFLLVDRQTFEGVSIAGIESLSLLGVNDRGMLVGGARSQVLFGDALEHAVEVTAGAGGFAAKRLDPPSAARGAIATGVDEAGTVVGISRRDEGPAGFALAAGDHVELQVPSARWTEAHDVHDREIVGALSTAPDRVHGFLRTREAKLVPIDLPFALQTRVLGIGGGRSLAGAFVDPAGYTRPFVLRSLPVSVLVPSTVVTPAPEDRNFEILHACGHTETGPFEHLTATATLEGAPRFSASHVSYAIDLVDFRGAKGGYLRYRTSQAGPITLHMYPAPPVRLYRAADEARVVANRAERTGLCPKIGWFHQFNIPAGDTYVLEIGPTDLSRVNLVYERKWAVD